MLCPELAQPPLPVIITAANIDSIKVSTYERIPGTKVIVTCFVPTSYSLIGDNVITCQSNGEWDKPIPRCTPKTSNIPSQATTTVQPIAPADLSLLPYMIGAALGGLLCLFLAILMCCAACNARKTRQKPSHPDKRCSSPGTVTSSLRDYRYTMSDKVPRESWRSRPCASISTIGSIDRFVSRDRPVTFIPRPAWFTMLPRQDEIVSPYV